MTTKIPIKYFKRTFVIIACFICILSLPASAAQTTSTKKKAVVTINSYGKTQTKNGVTAEYLFELPQLEGNSSAVKTINASLNQIYNNDRKGESSNYSDQTRTYGGCDNLMDNLKSSASQLKKIGVSKIYQTTKCNVSYNKKGVVAFQFVFSRYGGGVHGTNYSYGVSYDLKTGKKLELKDVIKGAKTNSKALKLIAKAFNKKLGPSYASEARLKKAIKQHYKEGGLHFYLSGGKVKVNTGSYAPCGLNGECTVILDGKY